MFHWFCRRTSAVAGSTWSELDSLVSDLNSSTEAQKSPEMVVVDVPMASSEERLCCPGLLALLHPSLSDINVNVSRGLGDEHLKWHIINTWLSGLGNFPDPFLVLSPRPSRRRSCLLSTLREFLKAIRGGGVFCCKQGKEWESLWESCDIDGIVLKPFYWTAL